MDNIWNSIVDSTRPQNVDILHERICGFYSVSAADATDKIKKIQEYYISKAFQRSLAGVTTHQSKFKREMIEFLSSDRKKFTAEENNKFSGMAYRLVEFYENDIQVDEIVQSNFANFLPATVSNGNMWTEKPYFKSYFTDATLHLHKLMQQKRRNFTKFTALMKLTDNEGTHHAAKLELSGSVFTPKLISLAFSQPAKINQLSTSYGRFGDVGILNITNMRD